MSSDKIMSFNAIGWYVVSTTRDMTWTEALKEWGISYHTVYRYIFELSDVVAHEDTVDRNNWIKIDTTDTSANPEIEANRGYWIKILYIVTTDFTYDNIDYKNSDAIGELTLETIANFLVKKGVIVSTNNLEKDKLTAIKIGYLVTSIGNNAFSSCTRLTGDLIIPESVTSIEYKAFSDCSGFTGTLTIPDSVTSIGDFAFYNCSGFNILVIGQNVSDISENAFQFCNLSTILIHENSANSLDTLFDISGGVTTNFFGLTKETLVFKFNNMLPSNVIPLGNIGYQTDNLITFNTESSSFSEELKLYDSSGNIIVNDNIIYNESNKLQINNGLSVGTYYIAGGVILSQTPSMIFMDKWLAVANNNNTDTDSFTLTYSVGSNENDPVTKNLIKNEVIWFSFDIINNN